MANEPVALDLELLVRTELDDFPLNAPFDAKMLARCFEEVADEAGSDPMRAADWLRIIAAALANHSGAWQLRLTRRAGRYVATKDKIGRVQSPKLISEEFAQLTDQGWPADAAVERLAESHGRDRSHIYKLRREQKDIQDALTEAKASRSSGDPPSK